MSTAATSKTGTSVRADELPPAHIIFGSSPRMLAIRRMLEKVAPSSVPILIEGKSGTGKGVLAQFIHSISGVATAAFVKVNCAAIPGALLESELFGYEKGAFTGAYSAKPGRIELADGGTLFLDGIDEIDMSLQAKLLQLLQDGQYSRIGGQQDRHVSLRVLSATTRPIEDQIARGEFRADLFYRINVVRVSLPTLHSRAQDIEQLAPYFLSLHQTRHHAVAQPLSPEVMRLVTKHPWPGNIRELENLIERYVILGSEEAISADLLHSEHASRRPDIVVSRPIHLKKVTQQAVQELEHKIILSMLEANHWNRKKTAADLKISYRALLYKIRRAGLPSKHAVRARPNANPASGLSLGPGLPDALGS